jgi:outer membrane protein OmpA-like peptidoglycan-associated protein
MKFRNMTKKHLLLTLPIWMLTLSTLAQEGENMVDNGSFEDAKNSKLRRTGDLKRVEGWVSPTGNSADLFSAEAKMPDVMTPENIYGKEDPKDGINYAGIITFSYGEKEDRTYLTAKLNTPMKKDMRYKVQFFASLAELSKYSANKLGAHFSKRTPGTYDKVPALIMETHIMHPKEVMFDGMYGWDLVCGEYKAEGGEKYITIGNFTSDNDVKNDGNRKPREVKGKQIIAAYYYIDDISVQLLGPNEQCECNYADEAQIETSTVYQRSPEINEEMSIDEKVEEFSVYYAAGRYDIKVSGDKTLNRLAEMLKENPLIKIQLTGHMDDEEAESSDNSDVSLKRAEYVRSMMVNKDVDASCFVIEDAENNEPSKYTEEGDDEKLESAKNRRVTFKVI